MVYKCRTALILISLAALSACSGSDSGTGIASTPPPSSPPPPPDDTSVELLASPATQELAVSTRDAPIQIRFDAARNVYELKAGNIDWSAIVDRAGPTYSVPSRNFGIAGQPGTSDFIIHAHNRSSDPDRRFLYSNIGSWQATGADGDAWGNVAAFGTATPEAGVPLEGSASYRGFADGQADIPNNAWGQVATTPLEGTVNLTFDFAAGSLSGSLSLASQCDCDKYVSTGPIAFSSTVFSRGSPTFSGTFATSVTGANGFEGRFTGPQAEELIGSWALPFVFEGAAHQAWGAWIAKREN